MRFFVILLSLCCYVSILASSYPSNTGAESAAIGGTGATLVNPFALHNNIANTALIKHSSLGVSIDNRFLFANIYNVHSAYIWNGKKLGAFSIGNSYSGYSAYYNHVLRIAYARKFGEYIAIGLGFNHHFIKIKENGSRHLVSLQLATTISPTERIKIAVVIYNPIKQKLEKNYKETLESAIKIGLAYQPTEELKLTIEVYKDLNYPIQLQVGAAYQIHPIMFLRVGAALNPTTLSAGFGLKAKQLQIDVAASWYTNLGIGPQLSLQYNLAKHEK